MDNPHKASLVLSWNVYKVNKYAFSSLYVLHGSSIAPMSICKSLKLNGVGEILCFPLIWKQKTQGKEKFTLQLNAIGR